MTLHPSAMTHHIHMNPYLMIHRLRANANNNKILLTCPLTFSPLSIKILSTTSISLLSNFMANICESFRRCLSLIRSTSVSVVSLLVLSFFLLPPSFLIFFLFSLSVGTTIINETFKNSCKLYMNKYAFFLYVLLHIHTLICRFSVVYC